MDDARPSGSEESLYLQSGSAELGRRGEQVAAEFLAGARGYRVVARNWRNPADEREEIDLIACDGDILVFAEVKTRSAGGLVPGFRHVGAAKKNVLRRAARAYLRGLSPKPRTFRLDVVEVEFNRGRYTVRHYAAVPLFSKWDRG